MQLLNCSKLYQFLTSLKHQNVLELMLLLNFPNKHFQTANNKSKAMMLNAFAKLAVKYEDLRSEVQMVCHLCS